MSPTVVVDRCDHCDGGGDDLHSNNDVGDDDNYMDDDENVDVRKGRVVAVLGASGGTKITTAVAQVAS